MPGRSRHGRAPSRALTNGRAPVSTTAFVLPGGGSLGAVQVGMLGALAERGFRPDVLVGASAGADQLRGSGRYRALPVSWYRAPFSFVVLEGTVALIDDIDVVRLWAARIGGRYMGADRAEEFGNRNGVPGEFLCRFTVELSVSARDLAD